MVSYFIAQFSIGLGLQVDVRELSLGSVRWAEEPLEQLVKLPASDIRTLPESAPTIKPFVPRQVGHVAASVGSLPGDDFAQRTEVIQLQLVAVV